MTKLGALVYSSTMDTEFADPIEPGIDEVSEAVVQAYEALPTNFLDRWDLFDNMGPEELAARVREGFANDPKERREILIAYLAKRLGFHWVPGRASRLRVAPLWDLLRADEFAKLNTEDRGLLWMIACSSRKVRHTLHPKASLAAVAMWRHGNAEERERARQLIQRMGLPPRVHFLYDLVRALGRARAEAEVEDTRDLFALAKLHLDADLWDVAALMGGLYLVRRFDPWYTGHPRPNLEAACDEAAIEHPFEYAPWILLMADAAMGGLLSSSWLERIVEAAIRLTIGHPRHQHELRLFHARRLYDATPERLRRIYAPQLDRLGAPNARSPAYIPAVQSTLEELEREVERTALENPFRAMRVLELVVARLHGHPLPQILHRAEAVEGLTERLLTLYVRVCHLDPVAVRFVREHHHAVDWEKYDDVTADDVRIFRIVGDYEATFGSRDADLLGVPIVHVDKDAAARVRYFQTSRTDPNSLARAMRALELPAKLPVTHIGGSQWLSNVTEDMLELLMDRASCRDLSDQVVEDLHHVGAPVEQWQAIGQLPITKIEAALVRGRQKDLLVAAATGGAAGVLAPSTTGMSAVMDVPLVMSLVADTCVRHCWYYGFDPREHPELPLLILAVALGGVEAEDDRPEEVRGRLQRYLVRRSILLAAVGQGVMSQLAGPVMGVFLERFGKRPNTGANPLESALGRLGVRNRRSERPLARFMRRAFLPAANGVLGASFNVSLVYDLCESAQAVLADRFLARKYPDWEPRF